MHLQCQNRQMQMSFDPAEFTRLLLWTIEKRLKIVGSGVEIPTEMTPIYRIAFPWRSRRRICCPFSHVYPVPRYGRCLSGKQSRIYERVRSLRACARSGPFLGPSGTNLASLHDVSKTPRLLSRSRLALPVFFRQIRIFAESGHFDSVTSQTVRLLHSWHYECS